MVRQPWYMRTQGKPIYMGFAWLVAFAVVVSGLWWVSGNIVAVVFGVLALGGGFWWLTRK
jgi:hypothetical protein